MEPQWRSSALAGRDESPQTLQLLREGQSLTCLAGLRNAFAGEGVAWLWRGKILALENLL